MASLGSLDIGNSRTTPVGADLQTRATDSVYSLSEIPITIIASPTPPPPPGPSRRPTPQPRGQAPGEKQWLHFGLRGKVRILTGDITKHPADMIVNPSNFAMSPSWNEVTKRIHQAAGPSLYSSLLDRYPNGLRSPPTVIPDTHDGNSPVKSYFNAVKHTTAFEMKNCNWIAHSRAPRYASSHGFRRGSTALDFENIYTRNAKKYASVFLALKRAHSVAIKERARTFTIAIPQIQYDGDYFTPRDDAVLTLSTIIDFFNHPRWGPIRHHAISHVDIIIDSSEAGYVYTNAYDFAWYAMSMHMGDEDISRGPDSNDGFLDRPYPADRPRLPILNPDAHYELERTEQPPREEIFASVGDTASDAGLLEIDSLELPTVNQQANDAEEDIYEEIIQPVPRKTSLGRSRDERLSLRLPDTNRQITEESESQQPTSQSTSPGLENPLLPESRGYRSNCPSPEQLEMGSDTQEPQEPPSVCSAVPLVRSDTHPFMLGPWVTQLESRTPRTSTPTIPEEPVELHTSIAHIDTVPVTDMGIHITIFSDLELESLENTVEPKAPTTTEESNAPPPKRSYGMFREIAALAAESNGFNGPYWSLDLPRKRRRAAL